MLLQRGNTAQGCADAETQADNIATFERMRRQSCMCSTNCVLQEAYETLTAIVLNVARSIFTNSPPSSGVMAALS